jgi:type I restriction enzyme M protein
MNRTAGTLGGPQDARGQVRSQPSAITGDDLRDFVDRKLFPYLQAFKQRAASPATIEYKIGEIFSEIKNKIQSGYNLREIIEIIDDPALPVPIEKHELSHLYEAKIRNMGNAGRNGGEYYTPRPLIRAMVQVVQPKIGERIYDGACGSAGFLCEAYDYLKAQPNLTTSDHQTLQQRTFYGKEKKSLAYVIAIMNMILHGIEAPNIIHTNTLSENLADIQDKDRYDVVLANPPFGGKERKEVQQNFPIRTGETAFLFLQHFIKILKAGGRGAVVIKNTFLSNGDAASLRKHLLSSCNLHTILDCPSGTFQGAGVKTVVLFFEKGAPTEQDLVLPTRPWPQPRQDQPAQRRRPRRVHRPAEETSPTPPRVGAWMRRRLTRSTTIYRSKTRMVARRSSIAARWTSWTKSLRLMPRARTYWRAFAI